MFSTMMQTAQNVQSSGLFKSTTDRFNDPKFRSGAGTVLGGLSTLAKGNLEASQASVEATNLELDAQREELAGRNEVLNLTRQLNQDLSQIMAASGASGGAGGAGASASIREAFDINRENVQNSRFQTSQTSSALRANAVQKRSEGRLSKLSSRMDAGFGVLDYYDRKRKRG